MGNLLWHEYSRFLCISASVYAVWSSFWAIIYRKFFWDFVGGVLRDPGGWQAPNSSSIFVTLIVKMPIIQSLAMVLGLFIIALEFPIPPIKTFAIHRSIILRVVLLLLQSTLTILYYQGTNAAIWSLVAAFGYIRALSLGETMEVAKDNRGKGGAA